MAGFSSIIGHEQIKKHLQNAISKHNISHAYIFHGPDKSGKMALAKSFAMALQCERKRTDACMECHSCKQALSGNQPDIIYLHHEKPNTVSVEDIRLQINRDIGIKPYASPYKIYIIDEAEKMNQQAQNALLKTIEEPPQYAVLLLLTTNADAFLPTILSRCVRLNLKAVPDRKIRSHLMQQYEIPDDRADICTSFAQGNVGKAIQLANSENFNEIKNSALSILKEIKEIELDEIVDAVKQMYTYKLDINDYFDFMLVWYRDILLYKATSDANGLVFQDELQDIMRQASKSSYEGICGALEALEKAKRRLDANVNFEFTLELLLQALKENSNKPVATGVGHPQNGGNI